MLELLDLAPLSERCARFSASFHLTQARFGLSHVFCWHSFYGYWAGIAPDSPEMATYNPRLVWPEPGAGEGTRASACVQLNVATFTH